MSEQIPALGAVVFTPTASADWPTQIALIARLWAELHEADPELARELARKLPHMEIRRA